MGTYFLFLLMVKGSCTVGVPLMLLLLCILALEDKGAHRASEQKLKDGIHLGSG